MDQGRKAKRISENRGREHQAGIQGKHWSSRRKGSCLEDMELSCFSGLPGCKVLKSETVRDEEQINWEKPGPGNTELLKVIAVIEWKWGAPCSFNFPVKVRSKFPSTEFLGPKARRHHITFFITDVECFLEEQCQNSGRVLCPGTIGRSSLLMNGENHQKRNQKSWGTHPKEVASSEGESS